MAVAIRAITRIVDADYVPRAADEAVRVFPFSKTRHGLYLDVVKNTFAGVQLHGEAQIWHLCL